MRRPLLQYCVSNLLTNKMPEPIMCSTWHTRTISTKENQHKLLPLASFYHTKDRCLPSVALETIPSKNAHSNRFPFVLRQHLLDYMWRLKKCADSTSNSPRSWYMYQLEKLVQSSAIPRLLLLTHDSRPPWTFRPRLAEVVSLELPDRHKISEVRNTTLRIIDGTLKRLSVPNIRKWTCFGREALSVLW